ncbi:uncharacterized protein K452DRAFT_305602 [Aplosporella prunicola CBS 121167]|uniref:Uncharacterized protein n=1 Tax=Aplosporella prunicola CBS 121167 TaxID=1176127 RepID=A0A6A6BQN5_9PEZI|nr:uncharacterized protein K452DRAFT_305602 [Aplosporella prunicola CBS 121167]KAF2145615.1 hypothetical protein K452DRAFT_305602 [Aplosporella prunicola CBS 121167]
MDLKDNFPARPGYLYRLFNVFYSKWDAGEAAPKTLSNAFSESCAFWRPYTNADKLDPVELGLEQVLVNELKWWSHALLEIEGPLLGVDEDGTKCNLSPYDFEQDDIQNVRIIGSILYLPLNHGLDNHGGPEWTESGYFLASSIGEDGTTNSQWSVSQTAMWSEDLLDELGILEQRFKAAKSPGMTKLRDCHKDAILEWNNSKDLVELIPISMLSLGPRRLIRLARGL